MRPSSIRALRAALSGWLVGLLAVGPAAAQSSLPPRLVPRALPAAASSSTVTVVAIPLDAAARGEAARLAYLAEQAVARSGRLQLVRLADALDAAGRREREARAAEVATAMQEGQRAYDELDTEKALQQFDAAVRAAEAGDLSLRFGDLSRARVMKAATQVANGENTAAQLEIRSVLAVDPRAQFSPNFFPPDEMAFVEKERKAVLAGATGTLNIRTEPVPAHVFVDGEFRGVSPVALTDVTPADHYVTVVAPGYALAQRRAREGDTVLTLTPVASQKALQTLTEAVASKPGGVERDRALRELGTLAGVSQVLALLVRGGAGAVPLEVTALRLEVADGHNQAYALGTVPRGDGMATGSQALLTGLVAADAPRQGGKPVTHFASGGSATRRTVGYVLLATGVALAAGGIYFGMEASAKEDEFKRAVQNSPRAQDIKDTGKTYALVADVGIIAGLVSAGLGGYFAFAGGGDSSPSPSRARPAPEPTRQREPTRAPPPARTTESKPEREALPMPPPPSKSTSKPRSEPLPMPPPPPAKTAPPSTPPPAAQEEAAPPPRPADTGKRSREDEARQREEELRKRREEVERQRRELEAQRKKEEEDARREQEAKRKREEEERRKQEEEKKKRPSLDEDDLRNY
ncbi:PEGA domain-containing protein [Pyxidicoccus xibeiensis]|uniref:PEGA domain-containing protein n=1 Tax=Pyxidicoccus xibeiensis TaxID=2906759 RepID=UPI0020A7DD92|nr:PEGA domain-containing protein [Pyxidicoccus xibeiensis]MCP3144033.1 PEGA domain-containing protein [Pyxidicoccus xibeiensis]